MILCVRCRRADVPEDEASMSGDGWLCESCFKVWKREEAAKAPKPWFHRERRSLDDVAPIDEAEFARSKRARAARLFAVSLALVGAGVLATMVLKSWFVNGGEIPAFFAAGPLAMIIGVLLGLWA